VFYTNYESRKGGQLLAHPQAALCFHWKSSKRQVRVEGAVEQVTPAEADAYFATRARTSQIGAWASQQSRPLGGRLELAKRAGQVPGRFRDSPGPAPAPLVGVPRAAAADRVLGGSAIPVA